MKIEQETEESVYLVEETLSTESLKITGNGRYLWVYQSTVGSYRIKVRLSFTRFTELLTRLETQHVKVYSCGDQEVRVELTAEKKDFRITETQIHRCSYMEKQKGIDLKCKIDCV